MLHTHRCIYCTVQQRSEYAPTRFMQVWTMQPRLFDRYWSWWSRVRAKESDSSSHKPVNRSSRGISKNNPMEFTVHRYTGDAQGHTKTKWAAARELFDFAFCCQSTFSGVIKTRTSNNLSFRQGDSCRIEWPTLLFKGEEDTITEPLHSAGFT